MSARLGGADIVIVSVQSNKIEYSVLVAPEIKSPLDLKGKIVTGTRPGASADSALRLYLRKNGLEPDKDVIFISVAESQQGRFNALVRGTVAGTVLAPPFSNMARQAGFRELADLRKTDIEYAGNSIAGMTPYIKSHPQLVENFLKGYVESLNFFRTQKERTVAGIMKFMKLSDRSRAEEVVRLANRALAPHQQIRGHTVWPDPDFPRTHSLKVRKPEVERRVVAADYEIVI